MPHLPIVEEVEYRDPADVLEGMPAAAGLVLLDGAASAGRGDRWSWLADDPFARFTVSEGQAEWNGIAVGGMPLAALRSILSRFAVPAHPAGILAPGATGFFSYEAGGLFERLPRPKPAATHPPEIALWFHDAGIAFDHQARRAFIVSSGDPETEPRRRLLRAGERCDALREALSRKVRRPRAGLVLPLAAWQPDMDAAAFMEIVARTRDYIAEGDIFQANLTLAWRAALPPTFDPIALYLQLRAANPAPYAALLVDDDRIVASTSPESFLHLADGVAETRPIKGTSRRSAVPTEDRRLADALLASEKDRAENVMIVDLMRNDFSRVCLPGTVEVPVLCGLESFASVHHLVSVVRGHLRPGLDALDLLAACFPGGSVTGAPKIRAMEIIHALEPFPRGLYCGSLVYLGFDGSLRSSIAIRTLVAEAGRATIQAGGGITLLSDPEAEYAEAVMKAERMLAAFEPAERQAALP
jgi:para-aminobenzoate synthetase component 1